MVVTRKKKQKDLFLWFSDFLTFTCQKKKFLGSHEEGGKKKIVFW